MTCVDYSSNLSKTANEFDSELKAATAKAIKSFSQINCLNMSHSSPELTKTSSKLSSEKQESEAKNSNSSTVADAMARSDMNTTAFVKNSSHQPKLDEKSPRSPSVEDETIIIDLNQGPRHVTICIDNELDSKAFEAAIFGEGVPDFGIIGLHTCGDLGPNLVRLTRLLWGIKYAEVLLYCVS